MGIEDIHNNPELRGLYADGLEIFEANIGEDFGDGLHQSEWDFIKDLAARMYAAGYMTASISEEQIIVKLNESYV